MKHDPFLDRLLGYQLTRAALLAEIEARDALAPFNITPAKLSALLLIRANPGCDQTALARALGINRSSAMKMINALSDLDLIERRAGRDARTNALFLLPGGAAQLQAMIAALAMADRAVAARLDEDDADRLRLILAKLKRTSPRRRVAAQ